MRERRAGANPAESEYNSWILAQGDSLDGMIGIDIVDVARFRKELESVPGLAERLFTEDELSHAAAQADPDLHLAGIFAAKEAVIKALGLPPPALSARSIAISHDEDGRPEVHIDRPGDRCGVSISHDAGVAIAAAIRV